MTQQIPHITRQKEQTLLDEVTAALQTPEEFPLLFHVWGIGGVGKSTCLSRLEKKCLEQASILKISFGAEEETPLSIMEKLYKQLPEIGLFKKDVRDIIRKSDPFSEVLQAFKTTLIELETIPCEGQESVSKEQIDQVRLLGKLVANGAILGTQTFATGSLSLLAASTTTAAVSKAVDVALDGTVAALSLKDSLLLKHPITKKNLKLQELMEAPLSKLTDAFIESIIQRTKYKPLVLILDTYEKSTAEVDLWLYQILLSGLSLKSNQIRIVIAGRYRLLKRSTWKELPSSHSLLREIALKEFDRRETKQYLEQIDLLDKQDVSRLQKATNGLPFHLDLIRQEKQDGEPINYSEEISDRLLKWLNKEQRRLVYLAACCRWFDQALIEWLVARHELNFHTTADDKLNCFEWLTQFDAVEYVGNDRGWYCLKDVARDAIRKSLYQSDRGREFRAICSSLQKYFEGQANQEIPLDASPPEKYEHLDWCQYTAEAIYYALFALRREECKRYFLTHFFASRHFKQINLIMLPFTTILAESEIADNQLLPNENQKFIQSIQLLLPLGWIIMTSSPNYNIKINGKIISKAEIDQTEAALSVCLAQIESLEDSLARFVGFMCKFKRCPSSQKIQILQQAKMQAQITKNSNFAEFSGDLFLVIGNAFNGVSQYEEAIAVYSKAIEINPGNSVYWGNKGSALLELEHYEEALDNIEKAIEVNPKNSDYWCNKSSALLRLERYEEALDNIEKAIEINPEDSTPWSNKGVILTRIKEYEKALESLDKAVELDQDDNVSKINRGVLLAWMGYYQEAIQACDDILEKASGNVNFNANVSVSYAKACCYALQNDLQKSVQNLEEAIAQEPDKNKIRRRAQRDPEFSNVRSESRFQTLVNA